MAGPSARNAGSSAVMVLCSGKLRLDVLVDVLVMSGFWFAAAAAQESLIAYDSSRALSSILKDDPRGIDKLFVPVAISVCAGW